MRDVGRVVAMDLRGHGDSSAPASDPADYSMSALVLDAKKVLDHMITCDGNADSAKIVVIGHSLGGAIAVRLAACLPREQLAALVVIDVVEGSAIQALPSMRSVINNRPTLFASPQVAVQWARSTQLVKNTQSARISIPSQIRQRESDPNQGSWEWKLDLIKTEPFWHGWFEGLSSAFLSAPCPRLLVLAGTDRLDKTLLIGQMQGKFRLELLPQAGHCIQEDVRRFQLLLMTY